MSTVVDEPFTTVIAPFRPMVVVPVEPEPSMIFTVPVVLTPPAKAIPIPSEIGSVGIRPAQNVPFPWSLIRNEPPARYVTELEL